MADTHAQGLEKLIPAFEALYDSMSDVQKKKADAIFGESRRHNGNYPPPIVYAPPAPSAGISFIIPLFR
jgi:hypothetical protein